jgi:hypothetical protein
VIKIGVGQASRWKYLRKKKKRQDDLALFYLRKA